MAGSVNKVILIGNVGRDPEIRQSADGRKIVNLSVATSETWKDKSGERQEKTEWHRVVIFNQALADIAERYVKKGAKLYVKGLCKPVNGPITAALKNIRRKSFWEISEGKWLCWTAKAVLRTALSAGRQWDLTRRPLRPAGIQNRPTTVLLMMKFRSRQI